MHIVEQIATKIHAQGGRAFYVGGYVRDKIMQHKSHDIDIEVFHLEIEELTTILATFGNVEPIGKAFGILKLTNYPYIDFAIPRTEQQNGPRHTDFVVTLNPNLPYIEAARRRDFTCNALMEDILTGEILDFFGGIQAIQQHIIQHVDSTTFIEDALRGLRAAQFATRLQFTIAKRTQALIQQLDYQYISLERIQSELKKGIDTNKSAIFLQQLVTLQIMPKILPDFFNWCQQQPHNFKKVLSLLELLDTTYYEHPAIQLLKYTALIMYIKNDSATRNIFIPQKKLSRFVKRLKSNIWATQNITSAIAIRQLKSQLDDFTDYWVFLTCFAKVEPDIIPLSLGSVDAYKSYFYTAIQNNPSLTPLVQGRDLLHLGFQPHAHFTTLLAYAQQLEIDGLDKEQIMKKLLTRK